VQVYPIVAGSTSLANPRCGSGLPSRALHQAWLPPLISATTLAFGEPLAAVVEGLDDRRTRAGPRYRCPSSRPVPPAQAEGASNDATPAQRHERRCGRGHRTIRPMAVIRIHGHVGRGAMLQKVVP